MENYIQQINDVLSKCIVLRYKFAKEGALSIVDKIDKVIDLVEEVRNEVVADNNRK
jgi:hypothetical protein